MTLEVGAVAPQFTLVDQQGTPWSLSDAIGAPVVLYFYPKNDTPGCTKQACDIRDHWGEFVGMGVAVAGISPDDHHSHAAFAARHQLPHTLLADPQREVLQAYGAWGERSMYGRRFMGVIRSSVVIDAGGRVAAVFAKIQPEKQSAKSLEAVRGLLAGPQPTG